MRDQPESGAAGALGCARGVAVRRRLPGTRVRHGPARGHHPGRAHRRGSHPGVGHHRRGQQLVRGLLHEPRPQPALGPRFFPARLDAPGAVSRGLAAVLGPGSPPPALRLRAARARHAEPVEHRGRREGVGPPRVPRPAAAGDLRPRQRPARGPGHDRLLPARGPGLLLAQQLGGGRPAQRARRAGDSHARIRQPPDLLRRPPRGPTGGAGRRPPGVHRGHGRSTQGSRSLALPLPAPLPAGTPHVRGGAQQGLAGAAQVRGRLHHGVLRDAPVAEGDAHLARQRAAVAAGDVHAADRGAVTRLRRRGGDLSVQRALAGRRGAVRALHQLQRARRQGRQPVEPDHRAARLPCRPHLALPPRLQPDDRGMGAVRGEHPRGEDPPSSPTLPPAARSRRSRGS